MLEIGPGPIRCNAIDEVAILPVVTDLDTCRYSAGAGSASGDVPTAAWCSQVSAGHVSRSFIHPSGADVDAEIWTGPRGHRDRCDRRNSLEWQVTGVCSSPTADCQGDGGRGQK